MNDTPKVSVIIPVWNPGDGISRCVASLRNQTLKDIEMLFVDDCGTDGAMDVVRAAAAEDPRIRVITNSGNMGAGASRNAAIEVARGEYLAFVDADDYMDLDFLEILYRKGTTDWLDIVKGRIVYELEDGTAIPQAEERNEVIRKAIKDGEPLPCFFTYEFPSALYHQRLFVEEGLSFGSTSNGEDTTFLLKACHSMQAFGTDDKAAYHYVCRSSSSSNRINRPNLAGLVTSLKEQLEFVERRVFPKPWGNQYVAKRLQYYLSLQWYISHSLGMHDLASWLFSETRNVAMGYSGILDLKKVDLSLLALVDYAEAVPAWVFASPWESPRKEDYIGFTVRRVDFLTQHPECFRELPVVESKAEWLSKRMVAMGEPEENVAAYNCQLEALWRRPSIRRMRRKLWIRSTKLWRLLAKGKRLLSGRA